MLSLIIPAFSRRTIVGYPFVAISTILTGVVGFGVWLHHMFTVGMSDIAMSFFSAGSMTIAIFTTIQVFAWLATVWRGRPVPTAAMHYAVGSIVMLVIGGLSGVFTGVIPADWQVHNTYYVVAHIHYVLIGSNVFPVFAAFYYWLPKMTGRMMSERLGKWSFWVMFAGFNVGFFPMHALGMMGMPRRIYTYQQGLGFDGLNTVVTIGAFILGIGILLSIINLFWSLRYGTLAGPNPWNSDGLEWSTDSNPAPYGSAHIPLIASRHPLWDDFEEEDDPDNDRTLDAGRLTPVTTWLDAAPIGIATIPEDSLAPLWNEHRAVCVLHLLRSADGMGRTVSAAGDVFHRLLLDVAANREGDRMSASVQIPPPRTSLAALPIDQTRGISAMWCVIATEANAIRLHVRRVLLPRQQ